MKKKRNWAGLAIIFLVFFIGIAGILLGIGIFGDKAIYYSEDMQKLWFGQIIFCFGIGSLSPIVLYLFFRHKLWKKGDYF